MENMFYAVIAVLATALAFAQYEATLATRPLLAETVTTTKPRAEYLDGARDTLPAFVRVLAKYHQSIVIDVPPITEPAPRARKAVGINLTGLAWYSSRQAFTNLLRGSY